MRGYTHHNSPELEARITRDLGRVTAAIREMEEAPAFLGILLLGGYGRGEGTPLQTPAGPVPFNDYDLVVVSQEMSREKRKALQKKLTQLAESLQEKVGVSIEIYLHTVETLRKAEPSLFNVEMRLGHRVLFGPKSLLEVMPSYSIQDIPLDEGTRLLMNRGKLLEEIKEALDSGRELDKEERLRFQKYLFKNALAFGDCLLLGYGHYALFYAEKREKIAFFEESDAPDIPALISLYQTAIEFKLEGNRVLLEEEELKSRYERVRALFLPFVYWYEARRLKRPVSDVSSYCCALEKSWESPRHLPKAVYLNLYLLGRSCLSPSWRWLGIHPRRRLLPALCLLLSQPADERLASLLGGREYRARFKSLVERLA